MSLGLDAQGDYLLTLDVSDGTNHYTAQWGMAMIDYTPPCPKVPTGSTPWFEAQNDVPNCDFPTITLSDPTLPDSPLSRVGLIVDGSNVLAAYNYLGESTAVQIQYPLANVMLDLWGGTSGTFSGLDRFGRIIDQRWINYIGGTVDIDRYKYGYDRNSNRTWKENTVSKSLGTPVYLDEFYTYDNLNRLTSMQRGQLTGTPPTGISGTPGKEQDWTLDKTGNWSNFTTKTTGTTDLNQTRTSNTVNELTGFTTSTGTAWATPAYDAAGNTITMPQPNNLGSSYTAVYDAWNRMVSISDSSNTVAQYQYDGRGRRAVKLTYTGGTLSETRHFYYSNSWQDLEERTGTSTTADRQYVWGARYVDELICRDDTSTRFYALHDANFNLAAITDTSGAVQERYVFYPYGQRLITDASWGSRSSSGYSWTAGHQGLMHDPESWLVYNRNRYLHPLMGRFEKRDPIEYRGDINLYAYELGNPISRNDWSGLSTTCELGCHGKYIAAMYACSRVVVPLAVAICIAAALKFYDDCLLTCTGGKQGIIPEDFLVWCMVTPNPPVRPRPKKCTRTCHCTQVDPEHHGNGPIGEWDVPGVTNQQQCDALGAPSRGIGCNCL